MSVSACSTMLLLILGLEISIMYQRFIKGKEYTIIYVHVFFGTHFWNNLKKSLQVWDIYRYISIHKYIYTFVYTHMCKYPLGAVLKVFWGGKGGFWKSSVVGS